MRDKGPRLARASSKRAKEPTKKELLLKDPDVRRWYDNVSRGSPISGGTAVRRLSKFCEDNEVTPKGLVSLGKKGAFAMVLDYVKRLEEEGKAGSYTNGIVNKGVKSWLQFNGIRFDDRIKVKDANVTKLQERVPTPREVEQIIAAGDSRAKVSAVLMAFAGLRPQSIGNFKGEDGLKLGDLLDFDVPTLRFTTVPARVRVRREISKAGHEYLTFLPAKGCEVIEAYLRERKQERKRRGGGTVPGETLTASSPLLASQDGPRFIVTAAVTNELRRTIRRVGFAVPWRPYVLRRFFATQCLIAENHQAVAHDFRVFWMGHKGGIEAVYTTNKGMIADDLLSEMREGYARASEFLLESKSDLKTKQVQADFNKKLDEVEAANRRELERHVEEKLAQRREIEVLARKVGELEELKGLKKQVEFLTTMVLGPLASKEAKEGLLTSERAKEHREALEAVAELDKKGLLLES